MRLTGKVPNSWALSQGPEMEGKSEFHASAWADLFFSPENAAHKDETCTPFKLAKLKKTGVLHDLLH